MGSLNPSFSVFDRVLRPITGRFPESVQNATIRSSVAKRLLAAFIIFKLVQRANRALSRGVANHWESAYPWKGEKELVLITGGCSGIGNQIVLDLVQKGVRVVVVDVQEPREKLPSNVSFYKADVTSTQSIKEAAAAVRRDLGDPTVLINNAGVGYDGSILDEPEELIRRTLEVNTFSHFLTVKEFLPSMIKNNHGHVVTIASMASFAAVGEMADYACSKAAALAFHECLTQELKYWYRAPKVRTSVIHPLWVRTPMTQGLSDAGPQFRQPIMSPRVVSDAVVKQILTQNGGQVILPPKLTFYRLIRGLPTWLQDSLRNMASRDLKRLRDWQRSQHKSS